MSEVGREWQVRRLSSWKWGEVQGYDPYRDESASGYCFGWWALILLRRLS